MNDHFDKLVGREAPDQVAGAAEALSADASAQGGETSGAGTPSVMKAAVQDLLRCGLIEQSGKPNLYRTLLGDPAAVERILEPFDLRLSVDEVRGIAFLVVAPELALTPEEAWQHPLVRRQRLTTEQSLLVALLRQAHIAYEQHHGIGADGARADIDDLLAQFDLYLGDSGSESRNRERLLRVLSQLQAHGIVSEPDKDDQISIRPIIVHLANPEHLQLLLQHFRMLANAERLPGEEEAPTEEGQTGDVPSESEVKVAVSQQKSRGGRAKGTGRKAGVSTRVKAGDELAQVPVAGMPLTPGASKDGARVAESKPQASQSSDSNSGLLFPE